MNETGFTCPKCGNTERFTADAVIITCFEVSITPDGWDYFSDGGDVNLHPEATLHCDECGYEADHRVFEEE